MNKKVLMTGANGFIGQSLKRYLSQRFPSWQLTGISRSPSPKNLCLDLNNSSELHKLLRRIKPDLIFHLAGGRFSDRAQLTAANYTVTVSLLQAIRNIPDFSPRIIIPGTAAEYGRARSGRLVKETDPAHPVSNYGKIKQRQTQAALDFAKQGMDIIIARIFNTIGEGTPVHLAPGRFASEIVLIEQKKHQAVLTTKNIDGKRDFLDIRDVCSALVALALKGKKGEIYNVCSGKSVALRSMARAFCRMSKVKNITLEEKTSEASESFDVIGSNAKIRRETKWKPVVPLRKSLENTLQYYRRMSQLEFIS